MERNGHIDPEWRTIAEFPQYEMNENQQVRHISGRIRSPQFNKSTYYSFTKNGKTHSRSVGRLYRDTFPEKDHSDLPKVGRPKRERPKIAQSSPDEVRRLMEYRVYRIAEFPEYGINKKGDVFHLSSGDHVVPSAQGGGSVHLMKDGKQHYIAVRTLMRRTFG
jgi:hypothetical protein